MADPILVNQGGLIPIAGGLATESCRAACCGPTGTPGQCCGDRGTFIAPIPATCNTRTLSFGGMPSLLVRMNGFISVTIHPFQHLFIPIPRSLIGTHTIPLVNTPLWIQGSPGRCDFGGEAHMVFPGTGELFAVELLASAEFPTGLGGYDVFHPDPSMGAYVGQASAGRSAIININLSGGVANYPVGFGLMSWYMNVETARAAASAWGEEVGGGITWDASVEVPIPLSLGACIPGIARNRALVRRGHLPNFEVFVDWDFVAEIEFDWSQSILPCPGDAPPGCGSCGGEGLALGAPL